ncbi:MAG: sugar-binding domain-containing protein [Spirochaetota bacterium]
MREILSLNGKWKFRLDPEKRGEHYPEQLNITHRHDARWMHEKYDDSNWEKIHVPACWQTEGYAYNGVAWYRTYFPRPEELQSGSRVHLSFAGVDYISDVWLNGHYLGCHEGYFASFHYNISRLLSEENYLAVRVDSPRTARGEEHEIGQLKETVKGALERWDANNPEINPGGIFNDVKLIICGPVFIENIGIIAKPVSYPPAGEPDKSVRAMISVNSSVSVIAYEDPLVVEACIEIFSVQDKKCVYNTCLEQTCFQGHRSLQVDFILEEAALWWTWDLGKPSLYEVSVTVTHSGLVSDRLSKKFGIRSITCGKGWETYLNNVRFFQRGANYLSDQFLSQMTAEKYRYDVELLKNANLNTVHPFCVVEKQEFYDCCDSVGMLVYQDFPIWLMASNSNGFVRKALSQSEELIDQYGIHPSIGIWNFGSQSSIANFEKLCIALFNHASEKDPYRIHNHGNAAFVDLDEHYTHPTRSFFWPKSYSEYFEKKYRWKQDAHIYAGWYTKNFSDLFDLPKERLTLVTEYGAQSLPGLATLKKIIKPEDLFPPNWNAYAKRCLQPELLLSHVPLSETIEEFIEDTQKYQAELIKYHTDYYRRHKYDPCNGAHLFLFNDCWPSITWSVVEYDRTPKKGYYALQQSMRPLQVILSYRSFTIPINEKVEYQVYVVNDFGRDFNNGLVLIEITDPSNTVVEHTKQSCDVPAVSIILLGTIEWTPSRSGDYLVTISFQHYEKEISNNTYRFHAENRRP